MILLISAKGENMKYLMKELLLAFSAREAFIDSLLDEIVELRRELCQLNKRIERIIKSE